MNPFRKESIEQPYLELFELVDRTFIDEGMELREDLSEVEVQERIESCKSDIISILDSSDNSEVLRHVQVREYENNWSHMSKKSSKDHAGLPQRMLNYILGLMCTDKVGEGSGEPDFVKLELRILELEKLYFAQKKADSYESFENYEMDNDLLSREITNSRHVNVKQMLEGIVRAYKPFREELLEEHGFSASELVSFLIILAWETSEGGEDLIENWQSFMDSFFKAADNGLRRYSSDSDRLTDKRYELFKSKLRGNYEEYSTHVRSFIEFSREDIKDIEEAFDEGKVSDMLDRITIDPSDMEVEWFSDPQEFNPVDAAPILKSDDILFVRFGMEAFYPLFRTFYYDLLEFYQNSEDSKEGEFGDKWGDFLEGWAQDELEVLDGGKIYSGVKYKLDGEKMENDFIIETEATYIVVECKTQKLTMDTQGGDLESLRDDIEQGVGKAYQQQMSFRRALLEDESRRFDGDNREDISFDSSKQFEFLTVVSEPYDQISSSHLGNLLETEKDLPVVMNIFNLQWIVRAVDGVSDFKDYIELRADINEEQSVYALEELDLAGAYIIGDLEDNHERASKVGGRTRCPPHDKEIRNEVDLVENFAEFMDEAGIGPKDRVAMIFSNDR